MLSDSQFIQATTSELILLSAIWSVCIYLRVTFERVGRGGVGWGLGAGLLVTNQFFRMNMEAIVYYKIEEHVGNDVFRLVAISGIYQYSCILFLDMIYFATGLTWSMICIFYAWNM